MLKALKAVLRFVIAVTERALRTEGRPRCIRGGSLAARAARRRAVSHGLERAHGAGDSLVAAAES